ncbi:MAG TPA: hypothetical protein VNL15_03935, partial [Dehalococcoidia bacterium]|nr:hypothetical protein [Dehalococcoidia bacterium]
MFKALLVPALLALTLAAFSATALANNDPFAPADECSGNPVAIGQPVEPPAPGDQPPSGGNAQNIHTNPVGPGAASAQNPGQSTGAKG